MDRQQAQVNERSEIDLSDYADPNIEGIRISAAAAGDPLKLAAYKAELSRKQNLGWCKIIHMDDDLAVVAWADEFVITLTDASIATPMGEA